MFQRVDVLDIKGKWLEANIVGIESDSAGEQVQIKVHFKGFTARWDELIDLKTESNTRIKEVGALSGAHGWAKVNQVYQERLKIERGELSISLPEVQL